MPDKLNYGQILCNLKHKPALTKQDREMKRKTKRRKLILEEKKTAKLNHVVYHKKDPFLIKIKPLSLHFLFAFPFLSNNNITTSNNNHSSTMMIVFVKLNKY